MGNALKIGGWIVIAIGAALLALGYFSDVTILRDGYYEPYSGDSEPPGRMVNYALMFGALRMMLAGGFLLMAGLAAAIGGEITTRLGSAAGAPNTAAAEVHNDDTDRPAKIMVGLMLALAAVAVVAVIVSQRQEAERADAEAFSAYASTLPEYNPEATATAEAAARDAARAADEAAAAAR